MTEVPWSHRRAVAPEEGRWKTRKPHPGITVASSLFHPLISIPMLRAVPAMIRQA